MSEEREIPDSGQPPAGRERRERQSDPAGDPAGDLSGDLSGDRAGSRRARRVGLALLLVAIGFSTALRIQVTYNEPYFDPRDAAGLVRSDQGLIYYVAERIADAGGGTPDDYRADPRIAHPDTADIPAMFSVGQEFLVAWAYLALGKQVPLHVVALWLMSFIASLTVLGVWGLAREWSGRPVYAGLAALLFVVLPINYRSLGILLLREDLSFPLFSLHLWFAARAVRRGSTGAWIASAALLAAALATWHAMNFVVAIEAAVVLAWFARTGHNPFSLRRSWIVPVTLVVACLVVPMLWSKLFLLSPTMAAVLGLWAHAGLERRSGAGRSTSHVKRVVGAALCVIVVATAGQVASRLIHPGESDYGHVVAFLLAKFKGLGAMPDEWSELPFGARLLWQGPFGTASAEEFATGLLAGLAALAAGLALALPTWLKGGRELRRGSPGFALLGGFAAIALVAAWLVRRTMILLGLAVPVLALWPFLKPGRERLGTWVLSLAVLGQGAFMLQRVSTIQNPWYQPGYQPDNYPGEIRHLVYWIGENIEPEQAMLGDFIVSTSILAHSRNPIIIQPKYETTESRERIEQFFTTFFLGQLDDMRAMMRQYETRYLFLDCWQLATSRQMGGMLSDERGFRPGTPAAAFLRRDARALASIPGFKLIYRTPQGLGNDSFRIFELTE